MHTFNNKVVWITGASSGIGEALTMAFAKEGAKLVLSSRRKEELERVKLQCGLNDSNCLVLPFDLSEMSGEKSLVDQVVNKFGSIDVLVNNGGISQRSFVKDTPVDIDRKIMEVNYFSAIALTKGVLPYMLQQKSGHFIVISSISGKFGFFLRSAYSASKHALHGFFESLRMEVFNDNIGVTIVCPGKIKTNISVNAITEKGEKHNKMDPSQENGLPADLCAAQILDAVKKNKVEVFIGGSELKTIWIKRFFPKLFYTLIRRQKVE
ncbi:MAG: SDR family oxidoreductase [Bacteroidetes bacterium]|nr:SDR family oxidoreductase [Bacteroidota bacterium]